MATRTTPARSTPARRRVLDTAGRLFYAEGVHTVGVDRIIAESGVAKATFYSHFRSKNDLVCDYLTEQSQAQRDTVAAMRADGADPAATVLALFERVGEVGCAEGFRGCPFLNAAAEFPDPDHPVRKVIAGHRGWFRETLRELLHEAGLPDADEVAEMLVLVRDGLVIAGHLDDPAAVRTLIRPLVDRVIGRPAQPSRATA